MKLKNIKIMKLIILIFVIFIAIALIIFCIKQLHEIKVSKLSQYKNLELYEQDVSQKYLNNILDRIKNEDYDYIINNLDGSDPEYNTLGVELVKEKIKEIGIMGRELEGYDYRTRYNREYNNVFIYNLKLKDATEEICTLVIKENAPNNYLFNFTGYLGD